MRCVHHTRCWKYLPLPHAFAPSLRSLAHPIHSTRSSGYCNPPHPLSPLAGVAVVASSDEQIQNAAVVSLLLVFVMVRVGVRPSIKGWKDQAEVVALGFTLTLKLHDMVHSYLTARILLSIDDEQRRAWQATIDQSDNFLVGLFIAVIVFVVLRVSMDIFASEHFKRLLEKRRCRLCLLRMCCGCKCKLCRLCCPGISLGGGRRGGAVEDGTIGPRRVSAIEMYRLSSVDRVSIVERASSAGSASSGRFGTGDSISEESVGVGVGLDSVVPLYSVVWL